MHATLKPGGYLILGATEVMGGVSDKYEVIQYNPGIAYRAINQ
jgi:chemotaxis protein methyltransferase CheR